MKHVRRTDAKGWFYVWSMKRCLPKNQWRSRLDTKEEKRGPTKRSAAREYLPIFGGSSRFWSLGFLKVHRGAITLWWSPLLRAPYVKSLLLCSELSKQQNLTKQANCSTAIPQERRWHRSGCGTSRVAKVIQAAPALRDCLATAKRLSHIELGPQGNALCHLQYVLLHLQYVYIGNPPSSELESATQRSRVEVTCVACKAPAK